MVTIFIITMVIKAITLNQDKKTLMGIAAAQNIFIRTPTKTKGNFIHLNVSVTKGLTVQLI